MRKAILAAVILSLSPALAGAVEVKNLRPCYSIPDHMPIGATRTDLKYLPGDIVFMTYDIEKLTPDATGKVSWTATLELLDSAQKSLYKKETPNEATPQLGGNRMPGTLYISLSPKQTAGKHTIKLTVTDRIGKDTKAYSFSFDVIPATFGMVGVEAPAIGISGVPYVMSFGMVHLGLDAKKAPDASVTMRVLDETGKTMVSRPINFVAPRDVPETIDLTKSNFVPIQFILDLNRPGRFTIDVSAQDRAGKKTAALRYPLTVLDISAIASASK